VKYLIKKNPWFWRSRYMQFCEFEKMIISRVEDLETGQDLVLTYQEALDLKDSLIELVDIMHDGREGMFL
jgi:hypothetical protein